MNKLPIDWGKMDELLEFGKRLDAKAGTSSKARSFLDLCTACGTSSDPSHKHCPKCGKKMGRPTASQESAQSIKEE